MSTMLAKQSAAFTEPWAIAWQSVKPFMPYSYTCGPLALVAFLVAPVGIIRCWKHGLRGATILMALSFFVVVAGYFSEDMEAIRLGWPAISARFLAFPVSVLVLWTVVALNGSSLLSRFLWILLPGICAMNLILAIPEGFSGHELLVVKYALASLAFIGPALVVVGSAALRRGKGATRTFVMALSLVAVASAAPLEYVRSRERHSFLAKAFEVHAFPRQSASYWEHCDRPDQPRRIAFSAGWNGIGHNWLWYPFLGRHLQNHVTYVPITLDGSILDYADLDVGAQKSDFRSWLLRLLEKEIDTIVCVPPRTPESEWASEHSAIFTRVVGDDEFGVFEVAPEAATAYLETE
jgi:hypothetical protein